MTLLDILPFIAISSHVGDGGFRRSIDTGIVTAYRPKPKSEPAKARKLRKAKLIREKKKGITYLTPLTGARE